MTNSWLKIKNHMCTNDNMMPKLIKKYGKPSILNTNNVNLFEVLVELQFHILFYVVQKNRRQF